jgi:hypothetical protein
MVRNLFMINHRKLSQIYVLSAFLTCLTTQGCTEKSRSKLSSGFPAPGFIAMAVGNPQMPAPLVSTPSDYKNLAYYKLTISNIPIGTAVVAKRSKIFRTRRRIFSCQCQAIPHRSTP